MLSVEGILRTMRFDAIYGRSGGSCFGVIEPSRLRPFSPPEGSEFARIKVGIYRLEFHEGYQFRTEPEPRLIRAKNDGLAIIEAKRILEIEGQISRRKFRLAGGKALFCMDRQVFPKLKPKKK